MKKTLLSLAALTLTASAAWANETTFVFDGEGNVGELTRIISTAVPTEDQCVKEVSFTSDGVTADFSSDLVLKNSEGQDKASTGFGFALYTDERAATMPSRVNNNGFYISGNINTRLTLSVPGGDISAVKIGISGYAMAALELDINGVQTGYKESNGIYYFSWTAPAADVLNETVTLEWFQSFMGRYVHTIEVSYTPDLNGKKEAGIAFSESAAEAIMTREYKLPSFSNPNKLPVAWSSTNESVATVDDKGAVTLVGGGKTFITAAFAGNDEFAEANARYELTVIPVAENIEQLAEVAPNLYDKVLVNFQMAVTWPNLSYAFVIDGDGNTSYIENIKLAGSTSHSAVTIYKVGDVIPEGWIATNASVNGEPMWSGLPEEPTETFEVEYPVVDKVTPADRDRVVILQNVTFTTQTPSSTNKAYGTTPDGSRYEFQNPYEVAIQPAGTYDVTCVVRYIERGTAIYYYLTPIAFKESVVEPELPPFPETFDVTVSSEKAEVEQGIMFGMSSIIVSGELLEDEITITLAVPEGWDGYVVMDEAANGGGIGGGPDEPDGPALETRAAGDVDYGWEAVSTMLERGYAKSNSITFPVEEDAHSALFYLTKENMAYMRVISVESEVTKDTSGISAIESGNGPARYFDLQGVETAAPAKGIYVKKENGTATKIIVK